MGDVCYTRPGEKVDHRRVGSQRLGQHTFFFFGPFAQTTRLLSIERPPKH
jgi:hypothetical protein